MFNDFITSGNTDANINADKLNLNHFVAKI